MKKKKREITFDPDMLHLTKDQIIEVIDAIIEAWERNPRANWLHIQAAKAFKVALRFVDDEALMEFWPRVVRAFDEINTASQMKRLAGEQEGAKSFFDRAIEKIRDPKFWTK